MVTKRQEGALHRWLTEAKQSGIAELQSLAAGILRDFDAVRAALPAALQQWADRRTSE